MFSIRLWARVLFFYRTPRCGQICKKVFSQITREFVKIPMSQCLIVRVNGKIFFVDAAFKGQLAFTCLNSSMKYVESKQ